MAYGAVRRQSLDVVATGPHLDQSSWHEVANRFEPVHLGDMAPTVADLNGVAVRFRLHEGPAQLGHIFDAATRSGLLPVDKSYGVPVSNNDVSGLQVVVDRALEALDQVRCEIVKLPHDADERDQLDLVT